MLYISYCRVYIPIHGIFNMIGLCVLSLCCRGFGFVTFTDAASVDKVLAQPHHELDSKTVSSNDLYFLLMFILCSVE